MGPLNYFLYHPIRSLAHCQVCRCDKINPRNSNFHEKIKESNKQFALFEDPTQNAGFVVLASSSPPPFFPSSFFLFLFLSIFFLARQLQPSFPLNPKRHNETKQTLARSCRPKKFGCYSSSIDLSIIDDITGHRRTQYYQTNIEYPSALALSRSRGMMMFHFHSSVQEELFIQMMSSDRKSHLLPLQSNFTLPNFG